MTKVRIPLVAAMAAAVAAGAIVAVLLAGHRSTSNSPVGTRAAGAQAASVRTKGSAWLAGSRLLSRITTDLARVRAVEQTGNRAGERAAGQRLEADAGAALKGAMPPADASVYRSAREQLRVAGSDAAGGRFGPGSARMLLAGEMALMKVTAAADTPVAARTPAMPAGSGRRP